MRKHLIGILLLLCLPVQAQMGSHLKEEFHDAEKYGVAIIDGVKGVRNALHNPETRVLCFQSFGEELPAQTRVELLEWVRKGNSLWFYDARLAPQFGMNPYFLQEEQFKHKPESGGLGGTKRGGKATVSVSFGAHPAQTGVGQVSIFLPAIETAKGEPAVYGTVMPEGDTIPLLQFTLDSPCIVAGRREGRGLIVFKNLLWTEPLSGDRFQRNLLEFSAGFQVPGPAGQGKVGKPPGPEAEYITGEPAVPLGSAAAHPSVTPPPLTDGGTDVSSKPAASATAGGWELELKDGTTLTGEYEDENLQFETGTGSLKMTREQLDTLTFGSSISLDKLTTVKGKTSSGLFLSSPIRFRTERGVEEFEKENIVVLKRTQIQEQDEQ